MDLVPVILDAAFDVVLFIPCDGLYGSLEMARILPLNGMKATCIGRKGLHQAINGQG